MSHLRFAFISHPVAYRTTAECHEKIMSKDPVSGKQFLAEVIENLTKPLTAEEKNSGIIERPRERFLKPETPDNLQGLFRSNNWTSYMPILLPTEEKVNEMLKGTSHDRFEKVGEMAPSSPHEKWSYNVEQVAVNAVMAGARPEYFPVILALASIGATTFFTSTNSFTPMVCVNGPIRKKINMNTGIGAFGPFNHANASIGCSWTLIARNLGNGGAAGRTYMGSQGQNHNYNNLCFAEREERLPDGWKPFHVQKGFKPEESVVSVFDGWSWSNIGGFETNKSNTIKRFFTYNTQCCGQTMVLDPLVADLLVKEGFKTKEQLHDWLKEHVMTPREEYWGEAIGIGGGHPEELKQGKAGVEPYASWLKLPEGATIPVPRGVDVNIMVTGGETNPYWQGGSLRYIGSASVDKWM
jgi:hypothetical protein